MADVVPFFVAGRPQTGQDRLDVVHPHDGTVVATASVPTAAQVEAAVSAAYEVRHEAARLPVSVRAEALAHVSRRLSERLDEVAELITAESGKPIRWARSEAARAVTTFRWAAEEVRREGGELMRLDTDAVGAGRAAIVRRFPKGPVLAIAPFNFPLNLVAHKVAPALAVGAPVVVKPAPSTPLSALLLGELLAETELPPPMWSVLPVGNESMPGLVRDPRLPVVSFTGSGPVGHSILDAVPRKHVTLELGGNAAALVCPDWSSPADLDFAADRIATFGSYQGGQSCVSVQRVLVHRPLLDELLERLVDQVAKQVTGDPRNEATDVGPLIDEFAARRVEAWVDEAVAGGARVLTGGSREGTAYAPTVLVDVPPDSRCATEEIFGPVLTVSTFSCVAEAFEQVNGSRFGLQAGVFTHDLQVAFAAHRELEVGGVVVGDVPSYRADQMPYGGVKESGVGREGVRYAMTDFTYERVLVLTGLDL
jgi:acyl-CoA reductase-like NAD-dependent aldehyde dehydrogenase